MVLPAIPEVQRIGPPLQFALMAVQPGS